MKELELVFENSGGKEHKFKPTTINENMTGDEVHEKMNAFNKLTILKKDGISLFQKSVSARYVITTEDVLFTTSK